MCYTGCMDISELMKNCTLCPRECNADRLNGQPGCCGMPAEIVAARAALHYWEEPCISGRAGSGAVFFSGCNLRCVFCQNRRIAAGREGKTISIERLCEIFLELQEKGANNINLVTPTHYVPQIAAALESAKAQGLAVPIVYNTGSYEKVSTLRMLDGLVDIYLPDFKYYSGELSTRYANAPDYFPVVCAAIAEMVRQVGEPIFSPAAAPDTEPLLRRGVIVRHLVLPGQTRDSKKILRYLHETYGDRIYISILNQYTPLPHVAHIPELNRPVSAGEYDRVLTFAQRIGITRGYIQEGGTVAESFIPEFDGEGILSPGRSSL